MRSYYEGNEQNSIFNTVCHKVALLIYTGLPYRYRKIKSVGLARDETFHFVIYKAAEEMSMGIGMIYLKFTALNSEVDGKWKGL